MKKIDVKNKKYYIHFDGSYSYVSDKKLSPDFFESSTNTFDSEKAAIKALRSWLKEEIENFKFYIRDYKNAFKNLKKG